MGWGGGGFRAALSALLFPLRFINWASRTSEVFSPGVALYEALSLRVLLSNGNSPPSFDITRLLESLERFIRPA